MSKFYLDQSNLEDLLFCSFRYALGRRTYMPTTIGTLLIEYAYALSASGRRKIMLEIKRAVNEGNAGDDCDIVEWQAVYNKLQEIDDARKKENE